MPRRASVTPNAHLHITLNPEVKVKLDLHLFSELEGRIPKGAHQSFITERIQEFFDWKRLDLSPFGFPQGYFISGPKGMVELLHQHLLKGA